MHKRLWQQIILVRNYRLCFQSERSSGQSLQFLRPTHQNFNFISFSGRFGRIFCLFFMAKIQFPHEKSCLEIHLLTIIQ